MIKHIVFYKLTDCTKENCEALRDKFLTMRGQIPAAKEVNAYIDYLRSERSFDVMLEVITESAEGLAEYKAHPFHLENVKPYVHSVIKESASVDGIY